MKLSMKRALLPLAVSAAIAAPMSAHATNGMNMDGYGPIATGMGGASMAYDNGTAAMMNNPATLGLMEEDTSRLDVAVGNLRPEISNTNDMMLENSMPGAVADSDATSFIMPALGYVMRDGDLSYGFGVFAQGGMGAEFANDTWMADPSAGTYSNAGPDSFIPMMNRSEVGVGRALIPVSMNVSDELTVGGSVDFVWAGMDLIMGLSGAQFFDMATPGQQNIGTASGTFVQGFNGFYQPGDAVYGAAFDFSNSNDFTGQAHGTGFAGKLGFTYQLTDGVTVGATYHTKTNLSDLETEDAVVNMAFNMAGFGGVDMEAAVSGEMKVKDFQWPATFAVGIAAEVSDDLTIAADVKRIKWSDVMSDFSMSFTADPSASQAAGSVAQQMVGAMEAALSTTSIVMDATMYQNWDDQTVIQLGAAYDVSDDVVLRVGYNGSTNPVPDTTVNPLFPATIEDHYTFGLGLNTSEDAQLNLSVTVAPEVTVNQAGDPGNDMDDMTITHSQTSFQLMYSMQF